MNIKLPHIDQWRDTEDKNWAGKTCAICCLKMILVFRNPENENLKIMDLVDEGIQMGGYINKIGWSHKAIMELALKHGVSMEYQKLFYTTSDEKIEGLKFINKNLESGKPLIASIMNRNRTGGHLVVIYGFEKDGRSVSGYHVLDPDSKGDIEYFLDKNEFLDVWRGGLIWLL